MEHIDITIKAQGKEYCVDTHGKNYVFRQRDLSGRCAYSIKRVVTDRFLVLKLISDLMAGKEVDISSWYAFGVGRDEVGTQL